jgi:uncharacterized membrane protein YfcA
MTQDIFALLAGSMVGFSLGLIGGGGSILAVPLLLYLVGVADPRLAIGTSALAVAVDALANLVPHSRAGHVRWREVTLFGSSTSLAQHSVRAWVRASTVTSCSPSLL